MYYYTERFSAKFPAHGRQSGYSISHVGFSVSFPRVSHRTKHDDASKTKRSVFPCNTDKRLPASQQHCRKSSPDPVYIPCIPFDWELSSGTRCTIMGDFTHRHIAHPILRRLCSDPGPRFNLPCRTDEMLPRGSSMNTVYDGRYILIARYSHRCRTVGADCFVGTTGETYPFAGRRQLVQRDNSSAPDSCCLVQIKYTVNSRCYENLGLSSHRHFSSIRWNPVQRDFTVQSLNIMGTCVRFLPWGACCSNRILKIGTSIKILL